MKIGPQGLVELIKRQSQVTMPTLGPLMLLLVDIADDKDLAAGFELIWGQDQASFGSGYGSSPRVASRTKISPLDSKRMRRGKADEELTPAVLAKRLERGTHAAAIINKRGEHSNDPLVSVGRSKSSDLILLHPSVSTKHAILDTDPLGGYFLKDAESTNGTSVNGKKLAKGEFVDIYPGDELCFGQVTGTLCHLQTLWRALNEG